MDEKISLKVRVQKFGTFLSQMVMPNIPVLIAWGFMTSLFLTPGGWIVSLFPGTAGFTAKVATMVGPMLTYLIPIMIAYTGGKQIYEHRGGVVGAVSAFGAIIATASVHQGGMVHDIVVSDKSQTAVQHFINATGKVVTVNPGHAIQNPSVTMILGAMILGPLGAWCIKKFDGWVQPHIHVGLEMLVNNFSAGFMGLFITILASTVFGPVIEVVLDVLSKGVDVLISTHLIPLANVLVDPAKILFLNNAINYGVLAPLGLQQVATTGKSLLFLIENNPGPGLGVLLAFWVFGKGTAKASAPGAVIVEFIGGIHEIYFPYVMMKPALFLSVIAGGVTGTLTNNLLGTGTIGPSAPGSIIAVTAMSFNKQAGGFPNWLGVMLSIILAALVSFLVSAVILRRDKSINGDELAAAQASVADAKAVSKGQTSVNVAANFNAVQHIIFACDAGMGSSAMGASILRNKAKKAGLPQDVTNVAIANLKAGSDTIVVTQEELAARAATMAPDAIRYTVANFMSSPTYDQIINSLTGAGEKAEVASDVTENAADTGIDLNQIDEVVFAHDGEHMGSATMGKETLTAIFKNHDVKIPVSETEFLGLAAFNATNIMIVTVNKFTDEAKKAAPNAQHLSVESVITTAEYDKMVARINK
ncbi:PTS transporter subunit EIIC [Lactococcus nasutitermitis]|uniref:PTS system mannitol-specific EIICB component n=1 Tax=Lactococcus nasutitermitis TaxID=1652957 RepID=A0ABV9JE48_9LACT|nr:PTS transporter subunit EIIC [Lactococcus nasutitermitis]